MSSPLRSSAAQEDLTNREYFRDLLHIGPREQRALKATLGIASGNFPHLAIGLFHSLASAVLNFVYAKSGSVDVTSWVGLEDYPEARQLLGIEDVEIHKPHDGVARALLDEALQSGDLGAAYCATLPADLRHRLGEYYTPGWLVTRMTERIRRRGVIADPACGDGRFLGALIRAGHPIEKLWGVEINPLAVMIARYNVWDAAGCGPVPPCRVEWSDFLLGDHYKGMGKIEDLPVPEVFVGNPPWVTWRTIPPGYRQLVAKQWTKSTINTLRGWNARVSAGQTDLSHLFIHEAIERVALDGLVCFVLPRSTFKGPIGSAPIRSGTSSSGRSYSYQEVWEIDATEAFSEVRSDTVVARLSVDRPQEFPVAWYEIRRDTAEPIAVHEARPTDEHDLNSSWVTRGDVRTLRLAQDQARASLRARGGINTGGANSVFHVRVLDKSCSGVVIENIISRKAVGDVNTFRGIIERDYLRPLLRGREIEQWTVKPRDYVLVPHDSSDLRRVVPATTLRMSSPQTWRYLRHFESQLKSRKELARWGGEWYELFRIGPYTADCWRVVWPHSSGQNLRAAILRPDEPIVPDQKVVLVAFENENKALFYCGLLNSEPVRQLVRGTSGLDASPNIVKRVTMPDMNMDDERHRAIIEYARAATARPEDASARELDSLAWALYV